MGDGLRMGRVERERVVLDRLIAFDRREAERDDDAITARLARFEAHLVEQLRVFAQRQGHEAGVGLRDELRRGVFAGGGKLRRRGQGRAFTEHLDRVAREQEDHVRQRHQVDHRPGLGQRFVGQGARLIDFQVLAGELCAAHAQLRAVGHEQEVRRVDLEPRGRPIKRDKRLRLVDRLPPAFPPHRDEVDRRFVLPHARVRVAHLIGQRAAGRGLGMHGSRRRRQQHRQHPEQRSGDSHVDMIPHRAAGTPRL